MREALLTIDAREVQEDHNTMTEQVRAAKAAYKREWAKKNPDKIKAQQARYWERQAALIEARARAEEQATAEQEAKRDK